MRQVQHLDQSAGIPWDDIARAAASEEAATAFTHALYRYPGSMSPHLARALILGLTEPGDYIVDPFCGGGTTAVEALAHGRQAFCSDINPLACFVTRAKASPLSLRSLRVLSTWVEKMERFLKNSSRRYFEPLIAGNGRPYAPRTHGLLLALRGHASELRAQKARQAALLLVLRVGQLCFHCREKPPSPHLLKEFFGYVARRALTDYVAYSKACSRAAGTVGRDPRVVVFEIDAAEAAVEMRRRESAPKLVLTSPPYPGVHVLYHRWQILGRSESSLPYAIIGKYDGKFESHYTMGHRYDPENKAYFRRLEATYRELRGAVNSETLIAQVVGFANPDLQMPTFRRTMRQAGFEEVLMPTRKLSTITRIVPNRRWYSWIAPKQESKREYVFLHRVRA